MLTARQRRRNPSLCPPADVAMRYRQRWSRTPRQQPMPSKFWSPLQRHDKWKWKTVYTQTHRRPGMRLKTIEELGHFVTQVSRSSFSRKPLKVKRTWPCRPKKSSRSSTCWQSFMFQEFVAARGRSRDSVRTKLPPNNTAEEFPRLSKPCT